MNSALAALKRFAAQALRRFLAQRGYALARCERGGSASLEAYVQSLSQGQSEFERIYVLDGDAEPVRTFLGSFPAEIVVCDSRPILTAPAELSSPSGRILIEIDAALLRAPAATSLNAYLILACVAVVRSKPAYFWEGQDDAIDITDGMGRMGFRLRDVLQRPAAGLTGPAEENIYFVFERKAADSSTADERSPHRYRTAEALNHLSAPISDFELRLTGRGSHGMDAGVSNPGALQTAEGLVLLARGEKIPWTLQKRRWESFTSSGQPLLLLLRDDLQIHQAKPVQFDRPLIADFARAEDFRLFEHDGRIYANHSTIRADRSPGGNRGIAPETLHTAVGVSRFDPVESRLTYLGSPTLDRPVGRTEKNWAMFSSGGAVRMIYSFNPYRLLSAEGFPALKFKSTIERPLTLPLPEDGLLLRNSINPIPYDSAHFLHIVHKVYPTKQYVFWAVLIDRLTLLPSKIAARPLLRGIASARASIVYACSAIAREDEVIIFGGLDDCAIGAWRVTRTELDRHWQSVA